MNTKSDSPFTDPAATWNRRFQAAGYLFGTEPNAMRARLFANIQRALTPGGTLVLQGYTPRQLDYKTGGPPIASHLCTEGLLLEAFRAMEILELREFEAVVDEGTAHSGHSALVGLVARKPLATPR